MTKLGVSNNAAQISPPITNPGGILRAFIVDAGMPLKMAPKVLGLSSGEFLSWWGGLRKSTIKYHHLARLAAFLSIDDADILNGSYDKHLVRQRIFESPSTLPERYARSAKSQIWTSAHIIRYLVLSRGQHFADIILHHLQVPPVIYEDPKCHIGFCFLVDLLNALASIGGLSPREMDLLPCLSFLAVAGTPLGDRYRRALTYSECYSILAKTLPLVNGQYRYAVELTNNRFEMSATLNYADAHFEPTGKPQDELRLLMRYRRLLFGWVPYLSCLPPQLPKATYEFGPQELQEHYVIDFNGMAKADSILTLVPGSRP